MCAELLIAQCVAQQVMQIAGNRQMIWGSSGLLPGGWKLVEMPPVLLKSPCALRQSPQDGFPDLRSVFGLQLQT